MVLVKSLLEKKITLDVPAVQISPWGMNDKVLEVDRSKKTT
jgi:hypothetical protein